MFDLTGFQRDLLYVINGLEEPSGQAIKEELQKSYSTPINHGRLYPNLDTLVNEGYVEKGQLDQRTNCYRMTESGRELLRERREWEEQYRPKQLV